MRTGDGGREIEHPKPRKTPGRIVTGVSPFCHSGLPELLYVLAARTLWAAAIPGKRFRVREREAMAAGAGFDFFFALQRNWNLSCIVLIKADPRAFLEGFVRHN
jgi:hypothetical protein